MTADTDPRLRGARLDGRSLVRIAGLLALIGVASVQARDPLASETPWSYSGETGPQHWGELAPSYARCATGQLQSPIDIRTTERIAYTPLMFQYRSQSLEAVNDGHGVRIISPPGSTLVVQGQAYDLEEIHFHVPGEHALNGTRPQGEIHFVHRDRQGTRVIVAVPVRAGVRPNSILTRIAEHLPTAPGEVARYRHVGINPVFLLPRERSYFRYQGSLDIPPCTEPVLWYVLAEPLEVDADYLRRIAQVVGPNARPIQPTNGRPVQAAFRR